MRLNQTQNEKSFASAEALTALVFLGTTLALLLPAFSAKPSSAMRVYEFQLAQDLVEIAMHDPQTLADLAGVSKGSPGAKASLEGKYARLLEKLGDYCIEIKAGSESLEINCGRKPKEKTTASRLVFDPSGERFFEASVSVGFHS